MKYTFDIVVLEALDESRGKWNTTHIQGDYINARAIDNGVLAIHAIHKVKDGPTTGPIVVAYPSGYWRSCVRQEPPTEFSPEMERDEAILRAVRAEEEVVLLKYGQADLRRDNKSLVEEIKELKTRLEAASRGH